MSESLDLEGVRQLRDWADSTVAKMKLRQERRKMAQQVFEAMGKMGERAMSELSPGPSSQIKESVLALERTLNSDELFQEREGRNRRLMDALQRRTELLRQILSKLEQA